jgi:hypothetical protein
MKKSENRANSGSTLLQKTRKKTQQICRILGEYSDLFRSRLFAKNSKKHHLRKKKQKKSQAKVRSKKNHFFLIKKTLREN